MQAEACRPHRYRLGPLNWITGASLMEWCLNNDGLNTPASYGIVTLQNSCGGLGFRPRQVQVTGPLAWRPLAT